VLRRALGEVEAKLVTGEEREALASNRDCLFVVCKERQNKKAKALWTPQFLNSERQEKGITTIPPPKN